MRRLRKQARRCVLRELDRQLQQRGPGPIAVKSKAEFTETPDAAAALRQQGFTTNFVKPGSIHVPHETG